MTDWDGYCRARMDAIRAAEPVADPVELKSRFGRVLLTEVEEGWRIDGEAAHCRAGQPFTAEIGRCRCNKSKCPSIGHDEQVMVFAKKVLRTYR